MSVHWGGPGAGHVSRWSTSAISVPVLSLDFLTGAPLDSRITFTRSTAATFVGSNGLIQTAATNAPRFDYDPITLAAKGLLIEEQRVNLVLRSEEFGDVAWSKSGSSVTSNAIAAPDGATTADKLVEDTSTGAHAASQFAPLASTAYVFSIFVKAGERTKIQFNGGGFTGLGFVAIFDVSNGTMVTNTGGRGSITPAGNGWYRCSVSFTTLNIVTIAWLMVNGANSSSYTGDGTSGLYLWGAQYEVGSFITSYIPTVASQVTRTADLASMTGTNFSSWYNQAQGTFVASYETSPNTFTTYLAASNGVVAQNSMHMDNDGSGNMRAAYYSGSSAVALLSLGVVGTIGAVNRVSSAYRVNDFAASRNGAATVTDTLGAVPVGVTQLNIGADPSGIAANVSNRCIRSITYYASRLTDSQLQALTT